ncbi:MAG: polysaccharide chain length determinant protein (PEP-CTERM system associated) [Pseudohongiellaceae bacterium]|jgi:polysaccharide chain length determinant protein (PEP-CTERM system associated)
MASAPRWCQIETANRIRISGFVEDSATKSWRHRGLLGARHFTHRLLGSFQKILYSRTLLEGVVHDLELAGPNPDLLAIDAMCGEVVGSLMTTQSGSESFTVVVTWDDPYLAKDLVEAVTSRFISMSLDGDRREAVTAVDFIAQQMNFYAGLLGETEDSLRDFKEANLDKLPSQIRSIEGELKKYRELLVTADVTSKQLSLEVDLLQARLMGQSPMVIQSSTFVHSTPYRFEYQNMNIRLKAMLRQKTEDHPDVVKVRANLAALKDLIAEERSEGEASESQEVRSPLFQQVTAKLQDTKVELESSRLKETEYTRIVAGLVARAAKIPASEMALEKMIRDVKVTREIYETLRLKVEQARINQEIELSSQENRFQILDAPRVPLTHSKPNRPLICIGGLIAALALGCSLCFLFEFLDPAIVRIEEVGRCFSDKVLVTIPKLHV